MVGAGPPRCYRDQMSEATQTIWLTQDAYDKLQGELEQLSGPGRADVTAKIAAARDEGDLRENGGYHAAREEQGKQEARIRQLKDMLRRAEVGEAAGQRRRGRPRHPGDHRLRRRRERHRHVPARLARGARRRRPRHQRLQPAVPPRLRRSSARPRATPRRTRPPTAARSTSPWSRSSPTPASVGLPIPSSGKWSRPASRDHGGDAGSTTFACGQATLRAARAAPGPRRGLRAPEATSERTCSRVSAVGASSASASPSLRSRSLNRARAVG